MSRKFEREVKCTNTECNRLLNYTEYRVTITGEEDPLMVTTIIDPNHEYQAVQCTCGHYTIISPIPLRGHNQTG